MKNVTVVYHGLITGTATQPASHTGPSVPGGPAAPQGTAGLAASPRSQPPPPPRRQLSQVLSHVGVGPRGPGSPTPAVAQHFLDLGEMSSDSETPR